MMSQPDSVICSGPPKKFLKKGEGLKRFAAYKPPLPSTTIKAPRRQTFVKFKEDNNNKRDDRYYNIPPDILNGDPDSLSKAVPKIAPPKIMHTPIKPIRNNAPKRYNLRNRRPLKAIVERHITPETEEEPSFCEYRINENINNLMAKIEEKRASLDEKANDENKDKQINNQCSKTSPELYTPTTSTTHSTCTVAFGQQIQQIQSKLNQLKDQMKHCTCGATEPQVRKTAPARKSSRKATKSKSNIEETQAAADAGCSRTNIVDTLLGEIVLLREIFDKMNLRR